MTVLDRKLLRDIWQTKGMLLAIVAIVAVGISCLIGFQGTYKNLDLAKDSYYARCRLADFWVDLKKMPVSQIGELSGIPGISEVRHRIGFPVIVDLPEAIEPLSGFLLTLPPSPEPVINNILLRSGSYFSTERRNEVIVSEAFAKARDLRPGSYLHLVMNQQRRKLYVVGTAISAEYVYLTPPGSIVPQPAEFGVFYVKRDFAADELGFQGATNNLTGLLTPEARRDPQPVMDEISRRLHNYGVFAVTPLDQQASNLTLSAEMEGLASMASMMPLIFLTVASLVLNVLMTRLAEQQRTIVGTLKALGYRNREVLSHFLKIGFLVGLLGAIGGGLLGYLISGGMTALYTTFFSFPSLKNQFYPGLMAVSALVALIFSLLGTVKGVYSVIKLRPAEAMRPAAPPIGRRIFLENITVVWRRLGFRWQMVLRNLFRNKTRTLIGIFAAAMGASLLLSTFGTMDAMHYMVDFQFNTVLNYNYLLNFRDELDYGAVYETARLPGVRKVEPILNVPCTFYHGHRYKKGQIQGLVRNSAMTVPRDTDGRPVRLPETGLLMTERLAAILNLKPGDLVRVVPTKGEQRPFDIQVAATVESTFGLSVFADYEYLNRLIGQSRAVSAVQIVSQQTPAERAEFLREIKRYPKLQSFGDIARQKKITDVEFVEKMGGMAYPMILFGAVIFFGSILNASLIGIVERQREIATFRVLGYQSGEIGRIFLRENLVQNIIGALLGLPLGWWMLKALSIQFSNDLYSMPCVVNPESWLMTLVWSLIFILLSQVIIQRAINRLDWGEALKLKE